MSNNLINFFLEEKVGFAYKSKSAVQVFENSNIFCPEQLSSLLRKDIYLQIHPSLFLFRICECIRNQGHENEKNEFNILSYVGGVRSAFLIEMSESNKNNCNEIVVSYTSYYFS